MRTVQKSLSLLLAAFIGFHCTSQPTNMDDDRQNGTTDYVMAYSKFNDVTKDSYVGIALVDADGSEMQLVPNSTTLGLLTPPGNGRSLSTPINGDDTTLSVFEVATGDVIATFATDSGVDVNQNAVAISPDGNRIAYGLEQELPDGDDERTLRIVDVDGSNSVTLDIGPAYESFVRFSPDGNRVAYFSPESDNQVGGPGWLYVISADGTSQEQVVHVDDIAHDGMMWFDWSPDGTRIVYTDASTQEVAVVDIGTGTVSTIGHGYLPSFSPNGTTIACMTPYGNQLRLALFPSDGSGESDTLDFAAAYPTWSPDGTQIAAFEFDPDKDFDQHLHIPVIYNLESETKTTVSGGSGGGHVGFWIENTR